MKLVITTKMMEEAGLDPNSTFILYLLYHKMFDDIKKVYGITKAIQIRNSLIESPYILSDINAKFTETILAKSEVEKLFKIRSDNQINFWEFYNCYPVKVGSRILRASGPDAQLALKHEKKYLKIVTTIKQHELAVKSITAYVAKKKREGSLNFLEAMETVINNSLWESWEVFIETNEQAKDWNSESI